MSPAFRRELESMDAHELAEVVALACQRAEVATFFVKKVLKDMNAQETAITLRQAGWGARASRSAGFGGAFDVIVAERLRQPSELLDADRNA